MQNEKMYTAEIDKELDETGVIRSAEILTIGTEILLGDLVDTNSAYLGGRLAALGVSIYRHTTVGDNAERPICFRMRGNYKRKSSSSSLLRRISAI